MPMLMVNQNWLSLSESEVLTKSLQESRRSFNFFVSDKLVSFVTEIRVFGQRVFVTGILGNATFVKLNKATNMMLNIAQLHGLNFDSLGSVGCSG